MSHIKERKSNILTMVNQDVCLPIIILPRYNKAMQITWSTTDSNDSKSSNLGDYRYDRNDYLAFVASIKFDNNSLNDSDFDAIVCEFDDSS